MGQVSNNWLTLAEKKKGTTAENGVTVQRASAGLETRWSEPDSNGQSSVELCSISYYQRELYPNGDVVKIERKIYRLEDLASQDVGETDEMKALAVLSGFIAQLGQPLIVDKILMTLMNSAILAIDAENNYPLHRDTREVVAKEIKTWE